MPKISRRKFLTAAAASVASTSSLANAITKALAIPANTKTKSIKDIEHIVILMQENRSFDHYFGTLAGVRGFNDPRAITLPSGKPVWHQPWGDSYVLPYHFDIHNTNAVRIGLDHSWKGSELTWKNWDAWITKKSPRCMGYFDRGDLPFYYALADAFTTCDAYHCSVFGPTDPNRFYALSGHAPNNITGLADHNLYNVSNGIYNADISNDKPNAKGIEWQTYAEILEKNDVSWKVYQEWDNYGDNYLQYFKNFRFDADGKPLTPDSPLYQKARAYAPGSHAGNAKSTTGQYLIDQLAADVKNGTLPHISWICAPTEYCEHPEATPNAGENFTARLLATLTDSPEVWAKTVLILTYDENDGFFDHMPSSMPPLSSAHGATTLNNATQGEVHNDQPIGFGPRVPVLIISPWTKGGRVCSELFDHTSLIRFMEEWCVQTQGLARENVTCPHISPWRRAVCGDMTSAFNFSTPNTDWDTSIPRAASYLKNWGNADALPPAIQTLPRQETSSVPRSACALPYRPIVDGAMTGSANQYVLRFANAGSVASTFIVYSQLNSNSPWHYTVEANKSLKPAAFDWDELGYHLAVHSHNGFLREFAGRFDQASSNAEVSLEEDPTTQALRIRFHNHSMVTCRFVLISNAYSNPTPHLIDAPAGETKTIIKSLTDSYGWYDFSVRIDGDAHYLRHYAGHLEGAGLNFTDPVLNGLVKVSGTNKTTR
ncbi:MAG: phospholipase C, phosphocholine-specific [Burkholderiales bacterium]|nr:phospholipase C, phosphocholine-specific [Burkholderiales bacterium]